MSNSKNINGHISVLGLISAKAIFVDSQQGFKYNDAVILSVFLCNSMESTPNETSCGKCGVSLKLSSFQAHH